MTIIHLKVGEHLKCACTRGLQSGFLLQRIKPDTGKLYENISKLYWHCFVVCKTVRQKGAVHEILVTAVGKEGIQNSHWEKV